MTQQQKTFTAYTEPCSRDYVHPAHRNFTNRRITQCPGVRNTETVEELAALIREVDGNHDLSAGALAEALVARGVTI